MTEPTPIHAEYTFTQPEWREATWAAARGAGDPARSRHRKALIFLALFLGLVVVLVSLAQVRDVPAPPPSSTTAPESSNPDFFSGYVRPLIPWIVIMSCFWFVVFRLLGGTIGPWSRHPMSQILHVLDASDEGLQVTTDVTLARFRWEAFVGWAESSRLVLLRLKTRAVVPIPKRALHPAALEELRRLLRMRVGVHPGDVALPPHPGPPKSPPLPGAETGQGGRP